MQNTKQGSLSKGALKELRRILKKENPDEHMTNAEIEESGMRLVNVFVLLMKSSGTKTHELILTEDERKVLEYIHQQVLEHKRSPSVREIATVLGLKSSRSGMRFLDRLIEQGLVERNEKGELEVVRF